jgi:nucleoside-diphosphate-sugar epimerase
VHQGAGAGQGVIALPGVGEVGHQAEAVLTAVMCPVHVEHGVAGLAQVLDDPVTGLAASPGDDDPQRCAALLETVLGLPFDDPPAFAPIDETHPPRPESSYALAKLAGETIAAQFARRSGAPHVGLRISNIMEPPDYEAFPGYWDDARLRRWNLWGYVDARDVALACERALTADVQGHEIAIIAAADTVMTRDSASLMAEVYPSVRLTRELRGRETLLSIERAREILRYEPRFSWTDGVAGPLGA